MLNFELQYAILIIAYNRPKHLEKLFQSLEDYCLLESSQIVIVQQVGNTEVEHLIFKFKEKTKNCMVLTFDGSGKSLIANISFNRLSGYKFCFDILNCDYVIALEDDVVVGSDILDFTGFIMNKYWGKRNFRGINYGSHQGYSVTTQGFFSQVRFGIQGPGSAIHRNTWKRLNTPSNNLKSQYVLFDGVFEYFLKTGFMITPVNSRIMDNGHGGTHAPISSTDEHFVKLKNSFVNGFIDHRLNYILDNKNHSWTPDALVYRFNQNWKYKILNFLNYRNDIYFFYKLERAFYRLFILGKLFKVK
jgi:hypothetical protein